MNIPALRFPEFKEDRENVYKKHSFNDIFLFSTGKNIKQNEASPEFETPCVRYGELYHMYNEVITEVINRTNFDKSELTFSEGNEILLPSAGEDPLDIGSASALTVKNVAIGRTINILKPAKENVYSQIYVAYYINNKLRKQISTLAKGVSISNVYNSDLKTLEIILPTLPEQKRIATFLTEVDTKLTQLKQKKTLLEQYKKGVMQKIFTQELRFKDDDGNEFADWEETKIGKFAEVYAGATPSTLKSQYWSGDIRWMNSGELNLKKVHEVENRITELGLKKSSTKLLPKYCVLIGLAGQGKTRGTVAMNYIELCTNQSIAAILPNSKIYNSEFLYQNLEMRYLELRGLSAGDGGRGGLNLQIIKSIDILLPSIKEQTKIANFLSALDEKITHCTTQIEKTEQWKKGLLQKMFC